LPAATLSDNKLKKAMAKKAGIFTCMQGHLIRISFNRMKKPEYWSFEE
jgi:hypothetical protein